MKTKPLTLKILDALASGPVTGQTDLMRIVLGAERTLPQCEGFRLAMRYHLTPPIKVVEERIQIPGTGHEGPPVFEYRYRLATMAECVASHVADPDPLIHEGAD